MAIDQPRHCKRHVERMAHVVVQRVAGEVPRVTALEKRMEIGEGELERGEVGARIPRSIKLENRGTYLRRTLDVDPIGDVVLVQTVLHRTGVHAGPEIGPQ